MAARFKVDALADAQMGFRLRRPPRLSAKQDAYPYQLDAVRVVRSLPYAAIFHEQGLGKTKIAIDIMLFWLCDDTVDTVFVVTKKMLVQNWIHELVTHSYITPTILSKDRRRNSVALNSPVLIYVLNYEVVSANADLIREFLRTCRVGAILDESQKIKNPESRLTAHFHSLAKGFERRIIMTGTPAANRPHDMWSQIKFLDDGESLGGSFTSFRELHDLPQRPSASDVVQYGSRLADIMDKIRKFSVRETKRTAGIKLPGKTIQSHLVELAPRQAQIYNTYRDLLRRELPENAAAIMSDSADLILTRLLRLVQCASNPGLIDKTYIELPGKLDKLAELLEEVRKEGTKAVVWTRFVDNVEWLAEQFDVYCPQRVHGRMQLDDREEAIRIFKSKEECRVLVATPGAAKEGLTLAVASHAIFYDRGFSLDDYLQAQDRIHRISQRRECFVHNIMARNTIDEWIDTLLNAKHQAARLAQGDTSRQEFDESYPLDLARTLGDVLASRRTSMVDTDGRDEE